MAGKLKRPLPIPEDHILGGTWVVDTTFSTANLGRMLNRDVFKVAGQGVIRNAMRIRYRQGTALAAYEVRRIIRFKIETYDNGNTTATKRV